MKRYVLYNTLQYSLLWIFLLIFSDAKEGNAAIYLLTTYFLVWINSEKDKHAYYANFASLILKDMKERGERFMFIHQIKMLRMITVFAFSLFLINEIWGAMMPFVYNGHNVLVADGAWVLSLALSLAVYNEYYNIHHELEEEASMKITALAERKKTKDRIKEMVENQRSL